MRGGRKQSFKAASHWLTLSLLIPLCLGQSCGGPTSLVPPDEQVAGFEPEPPPDAASDDTSTTSGDEIVDVDPEDRTATVVANAGPDLDAQEGSLVTLNGSGSTGKSQLSYSWRQVSGRAVTLTSAKQAVCTFTAQQVVVDPELFKFELTVTTQWNGRTYRSRDVVWVSVQQGTGGGGGGAVPPPLVAPFGTTVPTLDGAVSPTEWADATTYPMDAADQTAPGVLVEGAVTGNTTDTSAVIYLKQSVTDLYIAVSVNDDNVIPTAANVWDADSVEVFLDANNSDTVGIGFDRLQFDVSAGGDTATTSGVPAGSWAGAAALRSGGYTVEYRISKSALGLTAPGTYGFDVHIHDVEPAGTLASGYWYFSPGPEPESDESQWGDITLDAVAQTPGTLSVSTGTLSSSGPVGGPFSPSSTTYTLSNTGGSAIDWTASAPSTWLTVSKSGGTLAAGASEDVTVDIAAAANSLLAGSHLGLVTFRNVTNGDGVAPRVVTLVVQAATPGTLTVSPATGLASSGTEGGPFTPTSTSYTLSNTGGSPLNWSASKTQGWVSLSKSNGTLATGATDTVTVSIGGAANSLAPGNYNDTVTFTNTTSGSVAGTRTVGLTVTLSTPPGVLSVSPSGGLISWQNQGSSTRTPSSITYSLSNPGGTSINWTASKTQTWTSLSKTSGTLAAGATDTVVVSYTTSATSLTPGTKTDTVTFTNTTNGGGNATRPVTMHVVPTLTIVASPSTGSAPLPVQLTAMAGSSAVTTGQLPTGSTLNWSFGDSTPGANGIQVSHTYSSPGTFLITLTLTLPSSLGTVTCDQHTLEVASSTPAGPMSAASLTSAVTINGTLGASEWTDASSYNMDASDQVAPGIVVEGSSTSASDASAVVYVKQDATYLYVAVNVTDDIVIQTGANVWNADSVELFLDSNNSNTSGIGSERLQFDVNAGGASVATSGVPAGSWTAAAALRSGGYAVEYRLNKSALGLSAGTYGFDVHVYDVEPAAGTVATGYWYYSTGPSPETDESQWGDIILPAFSVAPVIADVPDHATAPAVAYIRTPTLTQGSTPVTWSLVTSPSGMTINSSTGVVSWSSPGPNASTHPITIRATNSVGSDDESWTLTVNAVVPVIADVPNHSTVLGSAYSRTPTLTAGTTPITWSLVSGPSGMTINSSTGAVTWSNPTPAGNVTVTIRATNSAGSDDETWTLTVTAVAPIIADVPDHNTLAGSAYSRTPTLTQGSAPVTWSLVSGPSGLSINSSTGVVTWSNPTAGNATVTIRATNSAGSDDETWVLSVTSSSGQAMTSASRTSGAAPLAVFFDATPASSGIVQPTGGNYGLQSYVWDFGDPGSGSWTTGKRKSDNTFPSRNEATGYTAAHVFESAGTYQVTLRVTPSGGQPITYTQQINVSAPTTTYYVSSSGSDSNNGTSSSTPFKTLSKGVASVGNGRRVLLNRGETFSLSATLSLPSGSMIGAYGTGAKPIIQAGSNTIDVYGTSDVRVVDLDIRGSSAITLFDVYGTSYLLLLRTTASNTYSLAGAYGDAIFLVDSSIINSQLVSLYYSGSRLVLLGNTFDQARDSHNLYLSVVDRCVISSNNIWRPSAANGRHCMRIGANRAPSGFVVITDNDFDADNSWLAIQFASSSGEWTSNDHINNLLFERNLVRNADMLVQEKGDHRNTVVRDNVFQGGTAFTIEQHPDIADGGGFDGPRGVWFYSNTITNSGGSFFSNSAPSSQNVYVYQNTVNGNLIAGNPPP